MNMSQQKPVLSVRIDQVLMDRLMALEDRTGVGRAEIIERCLLIGMEDEKEFVKWLESPIQGPLVQLLTHPKVLKILLSSVFGPKMEIDQVQQKVTRNVREKRKSGKLNAKPAV
jgi:hypothetical protein